MHEYSIVQALVERVEAEARSRGALAVRHLVVRIGSLAGVEPELLSSAYEICRDRTLCSAADLEIRRVEARWTCSQCDLPIPDGGVLRCPRCAAPARLAAGDEILLEQVEMEVP